MTPSPHPSPLALEQLLAGQGTAETTSHLLTCEACRLHLSAMEASARKFSASPKSLRAREAAAHADRRWKQRAASFTAATVAAIALISFGAPQLIRRTTPDQPPANALVATRAPQQQPGAQRRQGREVLEPRPEVWPSRLRKIPIRGRDVEFGQGALEAAADDGPSRPFTLKHTRVDIAVTGFMQAVNVTQTFQNPFNTPVEAVYVFPLPDDSAVHAMELRAGNRVIKAEIQRREQARATYEQAKSEGRRAALLDQERPNIFTQSVANLLPGETVEITISYVAPLAYDDGVYTLNFPMTVGPRYIPGAALAGQSQGTGITPDTDQVVDASRITPPLTRSGRDIEVNVRVDAGTVIEDVWTVSHRLAIDRLASARMEIALDPYDTLPNKDLILRWRVSGPAARAAMLAAGGAFALMLNPEAPVPNAPVTPKEMVFVIDTSCSMNGAPLAAAKLAMEQALTQMNPLDTFMLIDFAETASAFHDSPLPASRDAVERAVQHLRNLPIRGGTNQLAGIRRALARDEDPSRVRMVLLMTDGYIGNEDEILAETRKLRGDARVFGFGVGGSVNHYLLSRLSEEGQGFYQYIRPDEDPTPAVSRFVRRIKRPLITNVTIDWGGLPVADTLPNPVMDLFDAQPLIISGRYKFASSGTVVLKGRRAGLPVVFEVPVKLPELNTDGHALAMAWARKRIEKLSSSQYGTPRADAISTITSIGLEFHLVTPYTSLVAVEQERVTNVKAVTVTEPQLSPDQPVAVTTPTVPVAPANPYQYGPVPGQLGTKGKGTGGRFNSALQGGGDTGGANVNGIITGGSIGDMEGQGGLGLRGTGAGGSGIGVSNGIALEGGRGRGGMGAPSGGGGYGAGHGYFRTGNLEVTGETDTGTTTKGTTRPPEPAKMDPTAATPPAPPPVVLAMPTPKPPPSNQPQFGQTAKAPEAVDIPPSGNTAALGPRLTYKSSPPKAEPVDSRTSNPSTPPVALVPTMDPMPATGSTKFDKDGRGDKGDDFDKAFGSGARRTYAAGDGKKAPGYIPPAPGQGGVKVALSMSDVMEGVLAKKGELAACQAKKQPGTSGKIVMQWRILKNGLVTAVSVAPGSEEFQGTPMAECFANVIKTMHFPQHSVEGDVVKFPFKF